MTLLIVRVSATVLAVAYPMALVYATRHDDPPAATPMSATLGVCVLLLGIWWH